MEKKFFVKYKKPNGKKYFRTKAMSLVEADKMGEHLHKDGMVHVTVCRVEGK